MFILICILAGIAGTFLMTLFTRLGENATGYHLHVPPVLGSMVTMETQPSGKPSKSSRSLAWGYCLHYGIGISFAFIYPELFRNGDVVTDWSHALRFGFVAGLAALLFWFCSLKIHPLAPKLNIPLYLIFIFIGHLIFATGMNLIFLMMSLFFQH